MRPAVEQGLFFYILLHWAFPYDRRILQKEKEDFLKLTPEKDNLSSSTSSESESS